MNLALVAWWLAPALGLVSALLSMYVGDKDMRVLQSYKDVLPTLYFLATTSAAIACAEAAELLYHYDKTRHDERLAQRIAAALATSILLAVTLAVVYAKTAALASADKLMVTRADMVLVVFWIGLALGIGFYIKSNLERIRA